MMVDEQIVVVDEDIYDHFPLIVLEMFQEMNSMHDDHLCYYQSFFVRLLSQQMNQHNHLIHQRNDDQMLTNVPNDFSINSNQTNTFNTSHEWTYNIFFIFSSHDSSSSIGLQEKDIEKQNLLVLFVTTKYIQRKKTKWNNV